MKAIKFSLFKLDPDNTWAAVEEALHLLDMCDDDDDYKQRSIIYFLTDISKIFSYMSNQIKSKILFLTFVQLKADEILAEAELWIDSQGTEYGKTLRHLDELWFWSKTSQTALKPAFCTNSSDTRQS